MPSKIIYITKRKSKNGLKQVHTLDISEKEFAIDRCLKFLQGSTNEL